MNAQWWKLPHARIEAIEVARDVAIVALLCLALVACSSSTAPRAGAGRYELATVDGSAVIVPRPIALGRIQVVDGSVELRPDGTALDVLVTSPRLADSLEARWRVAGDSVVLEAGQLRRSFALTATGLATVVWGSRLEYVRR